MTRITVAHSPDSDDAFMFYALATGKIDTGGLEFVHVLKDIQSLNEAARDSVYDVTALSIHGYAYVADRYQLLNSGASMGEGYGPMVVARRAIAMDELAGVQVAVPGLQTSAYLALKLFCPSVATVTMPFDEILEAVEQGAVEAGLLIHEGQLTYAGQGLKEVVNLAEWWKTVTGLPLPLGGNGVRRDMDEPTRRRVARLLRESIQYSLDHRAEALAHAMQYARDLPVPMADEFIGMYVNQRTLDYGEDGREAVKQFLQKGFEKGLIPLQPPVDFLVE
ncbi:MAG: ABC transporter substrate-binding protein [Chloroflexi bacterium]|nr:ABC transporter substrate-binding protein [Chloroflexota bacterium]